MRTQEQQLADLSNAERYVHDNGVDIHNVDGWERGRLADQIRRGTLYAYRLYGTLLLVRNVRKEG